MHLDICYKENFQTMGLYLPVYFKVQSVSKMEYWITQMQTGMNTVQHKFQFCCF